MTLRQSLGLRVGAEMAEYLIGRLQDGAASAAVIGADARTGMAIGEELDLALLRTSEAAEAGAALADKPPEALGELFTPSPIANCKSQIANPRDDSGGQGSGFGVQDKGNNGDITGRRNNRGYSL